VLDQARRVLGAVWQDQRATGHGVRPDARAHPPRTSQACAGAGAHVEVELPHAFA